MLKNKTACRAAALALLICLFLGLFASSAESVPFAFSQALIETYVGAELDLSALLTGGADGVQFAASDPAVLAIGEGGKATVVGEGRASASAQAADGRTASVSVISLNPKPARRALLLSEQRYDDGRVRTGAVNTVQGLSDMLGALRYRSGTNFEITMRVDNTEEDVLRAIQSAFEGAQEDDVSLFYISCHGETVNGEPCLLLHDGTALSVKRLEQMLRPVPGRMIVLLDCCQSGAFIGSAADALFAESAVACFSNTALLGGKYLVMTSCGAEEDSYRLSDTGENTEATMSTVFARALCEGLGWDLDKDRSVSLRADTDRDGAVSFTELWLYTRRRVYYFLSGTGAVQTVMAWPEINEADLFARLLS